MRIIFYKIIIISVVFSFLGSCSFYDSDIDRGVVAQVNKYKMKVEDLKDELKNMPYDEIFLLKTDQGRREYVNRLLEKQVLIQEAQRQGLDKEKDFMKTIENYWEQALLKLLLQRKSKEISGLIYVSDSEINKYYRNSGEKAPFSKVKEDIKKAIRQEKETKAMDAWIQELRKRAHIRINEEVFKEAFSD
ncbi:SurA N-terminal domain-containing protein [Candidatus Omnitrophota bacterium]